MRRQVSPSLVSHLGVDGSLIGVLKRLAGHKASVSIAELAEKARWSSVSVARRLRSGDLLAALEREGVCLKLPRAMSSDSGRTLAKLAACS